MSIDDSLRFLKSVYGAFGANAGFSAEDLDAAEARLGVPLPPALRTFYRETGRVKALHESHNRLIPPSRVDFAGDHLAFYEENQSVVTWGIARSRLGETDPPVDQGQQAASGEWTFVPEFRSVSEFACAQGAWQAVQGGLPFVGVKDECSVASEMQLALGPPAFVTVGLRGWLVDGGVATDEGGGHVGLATRDGASFIAASAKVGIAIDEWDYATLRDE